MSNVSSQHRSLFGFSSIYLRYWKEIEAQLPTIHYGEEPDSFLHLIWDYVYDALQRRRGNNNSGELQHLPTETKLPHSLDYNSIHVGRNVLLEVEVISFIIETIGTHLTVWTVQLRLCLRFLEFYQKQKKGTSSSSLKEQAGQETKSTTILSKAICINGEGRLSSCIHILLDDILSNLSRLLLLSQQNDTISTKTEDKQQQFAYNMNLSAPCITSNNMHKFSKDLLVHHWNHTTRFFILHDFCNCVVKGLETNNDCIQHAYRSIVSCIDTLVAVIMNTSRLRDEPSSLPINPTLSRVDSDYLDSLRWEFLTRNYKNSTATSQALPRIQLSGNCRKVSSQTATRSPTVHSFMEACVKPLSWIRRIYNRQHNEDTKSVVGYQQTRPVDDIDLCVNSSSSSVINFTEKGNAHAIHDDQWIKHLLDLFDHFGSRDEVLMSTQSLMEDLRHNNLCRIKPIHNGNNHEYFYWLLVSIVQLPEKINFGIIQSSEEKNGVQSIFDELSEVSEAYPLSFSSLSSRQINGWTMLLNMLLYMVEICFGESDAALSKLRAFAVGHVLQPSPLLNLYKEVTQLPSCNRNLFQVPARLSYLSLDISLDRYFSMTDGHGEFHIPNVSAFSCHIFDLIVVHADKHDVAARQNLLRLAVKYIKWILPEAIVWKYRRLLQDAIRESTNDLDLTKKKKADQRFLRQKLVLATDMIVGIYSEESRCGASIWRGIFTKDICATLMRLMYSHPGHFVAHTRNVVTSENLIATIPFILARIYTHCCGRKVIRQRGEIFHRSGLGCLIWASAELFRAIWLGTSSVEEGDYGAARSLFLQFDEFCSMDPISPEKMYIRSDAVEADCCLQSDRASNIGLTISNMPCNKLHPPFEDYVPCIVAFTNRVSFTQDNNNSRCNEEYLLWGYIQIEPWSQRVAQLIFSNYLIKMFENSKEKLLISWVNTLYKSFIDLKVIEWNPLLVCLHGKICNFVAIDQNKVMELNCFANTFVIILESAETDFSYERDDEEFWNTLLSFTPSHLLFFSSNRNGQNCWQQLEQLALRILKNKRVGHSASTYTKVAVGLGLCLDKKSDTSSIFSVNFGSTLNDIFDQLNIPLRAKIIQRVHDELCSHGAIVGVKWWNELVKDRKKPQHQDESQSWALIQDSILFQFSEMPDESKCDHLEHFENQRKNTEQKISEEVFTPNKALERSWIEIANKEDLFYRGKHGANSFEERESKRIKWISDGPYGNARRNIDTERQNVSYSTRPQQVSPSKVVEIIATYESTSESSGDEYESDEVLLLSIN